MSTYEVTFTETALKSLRRYPKSDQQQIMSKIEQLAQHPLQMPNIKRLVNFTPSYRLRVGNYRVLFDLEHELRIIDIIDVLPRREAYRRK